MPAPVLAEEKKKIAKSADNLKINSMVLLAKNTSDKASILAALKKITVDLSAELLAVPMQANEQGHLFKSVHVDDVVAAAARRGVSIPKTYISMAEPIKSVGEHQVLLKDQGETFILPIMVVAK